MHITKYKLLICIVLLLSTPLIYSPQKVDAKEYQKEVVLFETKETNDKEVLLSRATKGITDNPEIEKNLKSLINISDKNGSVVPLSKSDVKSTTQKLKRVVKENGEVIDSYVTSVFGEASINPNSNPVSALSFDKGGGALDSTLSVYSFSRLYYNVTSISGRDHYGLTKVTGYWTLQDTSTGIKNTKVKIGQTGISDAGCGTCQNQTQDYAVGTSFSITPPSTWKPVIKGTFNKVGSTLSCTVTEGSQSWNVTFTNNLW
ncbi:hypothetical protein ACSBO6_09690 [Bacillus sp. AL-1R]